jgi:hypothetical protein
MRQFFPLYFKHLHCRTPSKVSVIFLTSIGKGSFVLFFQWLLTQFLFPFFGVQLVLIWLSVDIAITLCLSKLTVFIFKDSSCSKIIPSIRLQLFSYFVAEFYHHVSRHQNLRFWPHHSFTVFGRWYKVRFKTRISISLIKSIFLCGEFWFRWCGNSCVISTNGKPWLEPSSDFSVHCSGGIRFCALRFGQPSNFHPRHTLNSRNVNASSWMPRVSLLWIFIFCSELFNCWPL